jgi:hypothetical protein
MVAPSMKTAISAPDGTQKYKAECSNLGDGTLNYDRYPHVIYKASFGFDDRIYWTSYNWLQQFTKHYLTHCHYHPTGHSTENTVFCCQECVFIGPLPSNGFLLLFKAYASGMCLLGRCLAMGICVTVLMNMNWKDLEGSGRGLNEVLSHYKPA